MSCKLYMIRMGGGLIRGGYVMCVTQTDRLQFVLIKADEE